jgi:hypothetical protein
MHHFLIRKEPQKSDAGRTQGGPKWQIKNPKFPKVFSSHSEMSKLKLVYQNSIMESLEWNGLLKVRQRGMCQLVHCKS